MTYLRKKDSEIGTMYFKPQRIWRDLMLILLLEWNASEIYTASYDILEYRTTLVCNGESQSPVINIIKNKWRTIHVNWRLKQYMEDNKVNTETKYEGQYGEDWSNVLRIIKWRLKPRMEDNKVKTETQVWLKSL